MKIAANDLSDRLPNPSLPIGSSNRGSFPDSEYAESHDHRILIVDDEECVVNLFAAYLGETYSCETAANAQEALELLAREPFALVVTDMQMPGLSGIELLRRITEHYKDTAVIIVSGIARTQRVMDAIRVGASDYLIKPCDLDVLTISVERALERRMLLRSARRYKQDLEHRNAELARQKQEMVGLQAQVLQAEKMASLGQLAAGVAHELNNPLTAILGYSQLLTSCGQVGQQGLEYSEKLYKQAQRTHRIVQNLLSFARQHKPERVPVRLNQVLEDTLALRDYDLRMSNIRLHLDLAEDLPLAAADPHQLQQVFLNLVNNAVDAILEGSAQRDLWVRTAKEADKFVVEFVDSGPGVKDPSKVFDPFYTTKPVGKGTGLGLSICYGIISEHGGQIRVSNVPPRGACFTIELPCMAIAATLESQNSESMVPVAGTTSK